MTPHRHIIIGKYKLCGKRFSNIKDTKSCTMSQPCKLLNFTIVMLMQVNNEVGYLWSCLPGHLTASIAPARVESLMSRKTSTSVVQVTGCLPLPFSHSWRISVLISSASLLFLWAMILTLDPFLSLRRKVPNGTYSVATSVGMLTTLPSVHVSPSSSSRVGSVPG